ncbi:MAG: hypothetical protein NTW87_11945 [Planctomycetota bacterium]|nr:hypothetical protein [Planctomycetota bacterium]
MEVEPNPKNCQKRPPRRVIANLPARYQVLSDLLRDWQSDQPWVYALVLDDAFAAKLREKFPNYTDATSVGAAAFTLGNGGLGVIRVTPDKDEVVFIEEARELVEAKLLESSKHRLGHVQAPRTIRYDK